MSCSGAAVAAASKFAYANGLKAAGFKRTGSHLYRPSADLFHGIHFQASRWGSADEGAFTINLVITSEALYRTWTGKELPRNPASALFPVQKRIGHLMPAKRDLWWEVTPTTDIDVIKHEVSDAIDAYALPFFAEYLDGTSMLQRLRQNESLPGVYRGQAPLVHAILAQGLGLREEAKVQLRRASIDAGKSSFQSTVSTVAQRLGFDLFEPH